MPLTDHGKPYTQYSFGTVGDSTQKGYDSTQIGYDSTPYVNP